jgi:hypothetical protein
MRVTQLGIQASPGTIFTLNNGTDIQIGKTGIYELDLEGLTYLTNLVFTE